VSPATTPGHHPAMRSITRAPIILALAAILLASLVPAASAAVALPTADAVSQAERSALTLTNRRRTDRGLAALQWDTRLAELARARATFMAKTGTFSHEQNGDNVFDMMSDAGITWFGAGEIIAWNTAADLAHSTAFAVQGWMESAPHKAILLSTGYNYVAFGLAVSPTTGKRYWAGVYLKGPDRTSAWIKAGTVAKSVVDAGHVKVTITWAGSDTHLQVLTSGFRDFQLQRRRVGSDWFTFSPTTSKTYSRVWDRNGAYEFRVRARDKAGLWSPWTTYEINT